MKICVSNRKFSEKPKDLSSIKFRMFDIPLNETFDFFESLVLKGYIFCHVFGDEFGLQGKSFQFFKESWFIVFDIDKTSVSLNDKLKSLKDDKLPSVAYTTYSNGKDGLYSYRLVYLLDKPITTKELYCHCYYKLKELIGLNDCDDCAKSCAQMYYTNPKATVICNHRGILLDELASDYVETEENVEYNDNDNCNVQKNFISKQFLKIKSYKEFIKKFKPYFKIILHTDKMSVNDLSPYILLSEGYIELNQVYKESIEGKRVPVRIKNGEHRRKALFLRAVSRRIMHYDISYDELLYNAAFDMLQVIDNSDASDKITKFEILKIIKEASIIKKPMNFYNELIERNILVNKKFKINPKYCMNKRLTRKQVKPIAREEYENDYIKRLMKAYNFNFSIERNLEYFNEYLGIDISLRTLKTYKVKYEKFENKKPFYD